MSVAGIGLVPTLPSVNLPAVIVVLAARGRLGAVKRLLSSDIGHRGCDLRATALEPAHYPILTPSKPLSPRQAFAHMRRKLKLYGACNKPPRIRGGLADRTTDLTRSGYSPD